MRILVTGGAGYIGSHICVSALLTGHDVTIFDNFDNSDPGVPERIRRTAGRRCHVLRGDVRIDADISRALDAARPDAVIHLAGLKSVGDSFDSPLDYFETNVGGTACLLRALKSSSVRHLLFSSSATVYGNPQTLPLRETHALNPTSPYGRSKLMAEWLCSDFHHANPSIAVSILRYFNPVGAYPGGEIGDDPAGKPNNLMPVIAQVLSRRLPMLDVFGDDYPTKDGSGVRDYIHVCDLAEGHLAAISQPGTSGLSILNLGTGNGVSVFEMIDMVEQIIGRRLPKRIVARRSGDVAEFYADPGKAVELLNWRARHGLEAMCRDALSWRGPPSLQHMRSENFEATLA